MLSQVIPSALSCSAIETASPGNVITPNITSSSASFLDLTIFDEVPFMIACCPLCVSSFLCPCHFFLFNNPLLTHQNVALHVSSPVPPTFSQAQRPVWESNRLCIRYRNDGPSYEIGSVSLRGVDLHALPFFPTSLSVNDVTNPITLVHPLLGPSDRAALAQPAATSCSQQASFYCFSFFFSLFLFLPVCDCVDMHFASSCVWVGLCDMRKCVFRTSRP